MNVQGELYGVSYVPGESNTYLFGGNSNWRGPLWLCSEYGQHKYYVHYSVQNKLRIINWPKFRQLKLPIQISLSNVTFILVNFLIITVLRRYHFFYGDCLKVECPTGSGNKMTLNQVSDELCSRVLKLFQPDENGHRPCHGTIFFVNIHIQWTHVHLVFKYFRSFYDHI